MIVARCETLRNRIETKRQVERSAKELARFKKVRDLLAQHAGRLASLVAASDLLDAAGVTVRPLPAVASAALVTVRTLKESFAARPDIVVDEEQFNSVRLDRSLKAAAEALQGHLLPCWRGHALQLIPPANEAVLDALAPAFPREVRLIRAASVKLAQAAESLPGSLEEVRSFERDATSLHAIWGRLGGGDVPQALLTFLKSAASPAGAGLELLTDEVRDWLTMHEITSSFSVRVATSPR
jgi:hypothetical protein